MEAEELGRYRRGPGAALGPRLGDRLALPAAVGGAGAGLWRSRSHPPPFPEAALGTKGEGRWSRGGVCEGAAARWAQGGGDLREGGVRGFMRGWDKGGELVRDRGGGGAELV